MKDFLNLIEDIQFLEVDEFYERKEYIRQKYQQLDKSTKEIYKWYFYFQLCLLKNPLKELLWSYLNEEENIFLNSDLICEYEIFCSKRKKQKIIESQIDKL